MSRAIFEVLPALRERLPHVALGDFPTRVDPIDELGAAAFVKRDDLSSPIYGGNKVRTLEMLFARAKRDDATHIVATGAYGSNHAVATLLHARRAQLEPVTLLFPQPWSETARDNLRVVVTQRTDASWLPHWFFLPLGMLSLSRRMKERGARPSVMVPGGAIPAGALGYVSAALELALQVKRGETPSPSTIVIGVGSTCTSAGLLLGFALAQRLVGVVRPQLVSARVTPWPVTAKSRIVRLAVQTGRLLAELAGEASFALSARELSSHFEVDGRFLGPGYGIVTPSCVAAVERFREVMPSVAIDTTYTAKSAACFLERVAHAVGPTIYWATKSSAPLPEGDASAIDAAPRGVRGFLTRT